MQTEALVRCLLDDTGCTPDGYRLLAEAQAGDYTLKLWQGEKLVDGAATHFAELSLQPTQAIGEAANTASALGDRRELLRTVAGWLREHGALYVGSQSPKKLAFHRRLLAHYLPQLHVTEAYPAFDGSAGVADYFRVEAGRHTVESLLEDLERSPDDVDVEALIRELPSLLEQMKAEGRKRLDQIKANGQLTADNCHEHADAVATELVNEFTQLPADETAAAYDPVWDANHEVMNYLVLYADTITN